jgi:DNA-binding winged helix-turn-helix (wHTH) protein/Tfp pilus assembly protein PilF
MLRVHVGTLPLSSRFDPQPPQPVNSIPERLRVGAWLADRASGELSGPAGPARLEPKVADLLFLLAAERGEVVPRERLLEALWPGLVVGDDVLARTVFKLRQALGDDAKAPRYVETIAKRGYRLVADVAPSEPASPAERRRPRTAVAVFAVLALAAAGAIAWWAREGGERAPAAVAPTESTGVLVARADDFYFQFSRGDNESAIELYERVLGLDPDDPAALAGLANALTQRVVRWPAGPGPAVEFTKLGDALANGHLARDPAKRQLDRARRLAERAVELAPESSAAHKALGFVRSAQGAPRDALAAYERAIALDPDAWGAMINVGDVLEIEGRAAEALPWFERAYAAMDRAYERNPVQVRPWHAALGVLIAGRFRARGDATAAETWYRRVLAHSPLHEDATRGLAALLRDGGDAAGADRLCAELVARVGGSQRCD